MRSMGRKRADGLPVLLALTGLLAAPAEAVVYEGADAAVVAAVSEGAMTPRAYCPVLWGQGLSLIHI